MDTFGLCECKCGQKTNLAPYSWAKRGMVIGQPMRFISGHQGRYRSRIFKQDKILVAKCNKCLEIKSLDYFNKHREKGVQTFCKSCSMKNTKEWKKNNPERQANIQHRSTLIFRYGLTEEQFLYILELQNNGCAICGEVLKLDKTTHIDHNHNCCKELPTCGNCIRGILCNLCNMGLGLFKDNSDILSSASKYLKRKEVFRDGN